MIKLQNLNEFLTKYMRLDECNPKDDGFVNGLQIEGKDEIQRIAFAVDACVDTILRAKEANCDALIVHHGIGYGGIKSITGFEKPRIKAALIHDVSLFCYHLSLDKHPEVGNNIQLCKMLGVKDPKPFSDVGYGGELEFHESLDSFSQKIKQKLDTNLTVLPFGPKDIKRVAIISGKPGPSRISEAAEQGYDVILVGEAGHDTYHVAKENNLNVIAGGHYATETAGVQALANVIKQEFNIEVGFIDSPTGL
jgi:dinuclear metal center YbgI/SA1388 family protein